MTASEHRGAGFPVPPLARRLFALADANGIEARIVGGAVRDWLAGVPIGDIDMAVATPIEEFARICQADRLRVIETGLSHGTVTILDQTMNDVSSSIEVTQTRVDLATDGRHAVVGFSDDWAVDAARRDFTINAIYARADGGLEDPLGGMADLQAGRLRFAGVAATRVEEDALRMLRYCRFLPEFGAAGVDADADAALRAKASSAADLSGERVAAECRRLFGGDGGDAGIRLMQDTGLAVSALGVELVPDRLMDLTSGSALNMTIQPESHWLVRLAALIPVGHSSGLADRLRLSRHDRRLLAGLDVVDSADMAGRLGREGWRQTAYFLMRDGTPPAAVLVVASARQGVPVDTDHLAALAAWAAPTCPLQAADLMSHGVDKGPALGDMLRAAERHWVAYDFTPSKADLLALVTDTLTHE